MSSGPPLVFERLAQDPSTGARLGKVTTRHGVFDTPAFMAVGTQGTVKGILPRDLAETGTQVVLGNTFHLLLRPGPNVVRDVGGLHRFASWNGPMLTDSGGFQVFSLADINKITDAGVVFKSHVDGRMVELNPRRSMEVQNALGADIMMMFDECPSGTAPPEYHRVAVERTMRWAEQCIEHHARPNDQSLFGIVQGGTNEALREMSAKHLIGLDLPGYALGGLAVGEGFEAMKTVLRIATPMLPEHKPRYLMGVGFPRDIVTAVASGIDMFDCVIPTRNGRNAYAFTAGGAIRIRNAKYTRDEGPIEPGCDCYTCRTFTRAAIRHYFFASEMLGPILVSLHNIRFFQRLMTDIREAIREGRFGQFLEQDPRSRIGPKEVQQTETPSRL